MSDDEETYLLVVTHSGRSLYDLFSGERIARDHDVVYPEDGIIEGIGPLTGQSISVDEYDFENDLVIDSHSG